MDEKYMTTPRNLKTKDKHPVYRVYTPSNLPGELYDIQYRRINGEKRKYATVLYEDTETRELMESKYPFLDLFTRWRFTTDDPGLLSIIEKEKQKQTILNSFDLFDRPVDDITAYDFHRLVNYARNSEMCLQRGCTTCGCWEFRELCRQLGKEKMTAIVNAVPEEYLKNGLSYPEYTALELIKITTDVPTDNPLMQFYSRTEEKRRVEYQARQKAAAEKKRKEMQLAEERREKKKKEKAAWRERHNVERDAFRDKIKGWPLEQQLSYLCNEAEYLPGYYGIDFSDISDEELHSISQELLAIFA